MRLVVSEKCFVTILWGLVFLLNVVSIWVNNFDKDWMMTLKQRFLEAVVKGELGSIEDRGVVVTLKAFKEYFSDVKTYYINSFLPASTIESGRVEMTKTRFLFRIASGVYLVHPDAIDQYIEQQLLGDDGDGVKEPGVCYGV